MVDQQQVQRYLEARRLRASNPDAYENARSDLLGGDKADVLAGFEPLLNDPDEEQRCEAITGLAALYGSDATDTIVRWIKDESIIVRWVVCACLHDYGDERAFPALLDRLQHEVDGGVRGAAAGALGQIGAIDALPHLYRAYLSDLERDELGYSVSGQALEAINSLLMDWVTQKVAGSPPRQFRETTSDGEVRGTVTCEAIPFDPEGMARRYSHVPRAAFGCGCSADLNLQTTLVDPFEIKVEYVDSTCVIRRIYIYRHFESRAKLKWDIHTIVDTAAMEPPTQP